MSEVSAWNKMWAVLQVIDSLEGEVYEEENEDRYDRALESKEVLEGMISDQIGERIVKLVKDKGWGGSELWNGKTEEEIIECIGRTCIFAYDNGEWMEFDPAVMEDYRNEIKEEFLKMGFPYVDDIMDGVSIGPLDWDETYEYAGHACIEIVMDILSRDDGVITFYAEDRKIKQREEKIEDTENKTKKGTGITEEKEMKDE